MKLARQAPTLAQVVTAARAGALGHAMSLLTAGGFEEARDNPAALAVVGRLARDRALQAPPADRPRLFGEAAAAFAAAFALDRQPYARINQATLSWLSGDREQGREIARSLLEWLDEGSYPPETGSWLAMTRAEAMLLLGDRPGARAQLEQATRHQTHDPEDLAAALRRLELILVEAGEDPRWLDEFRPNRALHFAGHLGIAEDAASMLGERIAILIGERRVGAGFGALAAGADLVIAEALLDCGAELHVVLPTSLEVFAEQSVHPYGSGWSRRFTRVVDEAASLRSVTTLGGGYQPLATRLAADVAMGAARAHARRLRTEPCQLLVIDEGPGPYGQGAHTRYMGERWLAGRASADLGQVRLVVPRTAAVAASGSKPAEGRPDLTLMAVLHIAFEGPDGEDEAAFAEFLDTVIAPLRLAAARISPQPDIVLPAGNARILGFADPGAAWRHAAALLSLEGADRNVRIVGHYGLAHHLKEPDALVGTAVALLDEMSMRALPGVLVATEQLTAAACVSEADAMRIEEIGALGDTPIFALSASVGDQ